MKNTLIIQKNEAKKKFTILGFSIWRIFAYFMIYSIIGCFVETTYCLITNHGILENRTSVLYGPFCTIYGVGAIIMILALQKFKKNYKTLFLGGFIVGAITEYTISLLAEIILKVKWWDYSNMPLNINGRICIYFSMLWGILAILLIHFFNPQIDKIINWTKSKINIKLLKTIETVIIIFMFLNLIITACAIKLFEIRIVAQHNLNVKNKEQIIETYNKIYSNKTMSNIIYTLWGDKKMLRTFPNIKLQDVDGNMIYVDSLLTEIQRYYYKF